MKTTLVISISLFVATSVAAYFQPLFFIPSVLFATLIGLTLFFERFLPDKSAMDAFDDRLKLVENICKGIQLAKMGGK